MEIKQHVLEKVERSRGHSVGTHRQLCHLLALILAEHLHGWRKPDLAKITPKAPLPTPSKHRRRWPDPLLGR